MSTECRNKYGAVFVEFNAEMFSIGVGPRSHIDYDVQYGTSNATYQFGFKRRGRLIMHTSKRTFVGIVRKVGLNNVIGKPLSFEFVLAK